MIWVDILFDIFLRGLLPPPRRDKYPTNNIVVNVCCGPRIEVGAACHGLAGLTWHELHL